MRPCLSHRSKPLCAQGPRWCGCVGRHISKLDGSRKLLKLLFKNCLAKGKDIEQEPNPKPKQLGQKANSYRHRKTNKAKNNKNTVGESNSSFGSPTGPNCTSRYSSQSNLQEFLHQHLLLPSTAFSPAQPRGAESAPQQRQHSDLPVQKGRARERGEEKKNKIYIYLKKIKK